MDYLFGLAAIVTFVPALILMYAVLRKYTYPAVEQPFFSDPYFFGLFTVGLVIGTILFMVYTYILGSLVYVILYGMIQCLALVVVMNLRRFRGKSDSVFYGFGLGLGAGAATALGFVYYLAAISQRLGSSMGIADYVFLVVMGFSLAMQFAAVGTTVGEGIARHNPFQFAMEAMIYNVIYQVVFFIMLENAGSLYLYVTGAMAFAISAAYCIYTDRLKLAGVVRDVLRMEGKKRNDMPR